MNDKIRALESKFITSYQELRKLNYNKPQAIEIMIERLLDDVELREYKDYICEEYVKNLLENLT